MSQTNLSKNVSNSQSPTIKEEQILSDEINDNEEILIELDECLKSKNETIGQLKQTISNLENDIKMYSSPYSSENGTFEQDMSVFKSIASKYVKEDLMNFYVDRMHKCTTGRVEGDSSTISALCESISRSN